MNGEEVQFEALKKEVLRKIMTKEALERLGRVRLVNPILASQLELYLFQVHQSGQLKEIIDDKKLKQILNVLTPKRETKIKRR
ncbi:MAG: DNA-binding protein [Candidatus Bathyarchaeia archaeon]